MTSIFANNKGIRPRTNKKGIITSWSITVYVGIENGKRIYRYLNVPHDPNWTEKQGFEQAYKEKILFTEKINNKQIAVSKKHFSLFAEQWLKQKELYDKLKPNTLNLYRARIEAINKAFGDIEIKDITYSKINKFYIDLMDGTITGNANSACSIRSFHTVLSQVLEEAYKQTIVPKNEAEHINLPKLIKNKKRNISPEQYQIIIEAIKEDIKWYTFFVLDAETGLRRGELLGLKWCNIDLDNKTIKIDNNVQRNWKTGEIYECTPKTDASKRTFLLFERTISLLKQYKAWQNQKRLRLGNKFIDNGYVFTGHYGEPMHPNTVNSFINRKRKEIGIEFTTHDFRRFHASVLISEGVPLTTVAKKLGHSKVSTTLDIYAYAFGKDEKQCEDAYNRAVILTQREFSNDV